MVETVRTDVRPRGPLHGNVILGPLAGQGCGVLDFFVTFLPLLGSADTGIVEGTVVVREARTSPHQRVGTYAVRVASGHSWSPFRGPDCPSAEVLSTLDRHQLTPFTPKWVCSVNPEHCREAPLSSRFAGAECPECREAGSGCRLLGRRVSMLRQHVHRAPVSERFYL